jgi:hypothetical protein
MITTADMSMTRSATRAPALSRLWNVDVIVAFSLALAAGFITFRASLALDPVHYYHLHARDVWFDADFRRVYSIETDRDGAHYRTNLHPFFSLVAYPPVFLLRKGAGLPDATAVHLFHAFLAGLWIAGFYTLLRRVGHRRPDALAFTALMVTSTAGVFWMSFPETWVLGSLSLFPALFLAASPPPLGARRYVFASLSAIGVTVTNWVAAVAIAWVDRPKRFVLKLAAGTALAVVAATAVQTQIFPKAQMVLANTEFEQRFFFMPESGGPRAVLRAFFFHSMTAPGFTKVHNGHFPPWPLLSFQLSPLFSASAAGAVATVLWAVLLGAGLVWMVRSADHRRLRVVAGVTLLSMLVIHLFYGRETVLYSFHYAPLLVLLVSLTAFTRARTFVVAMTVAIAALNFANNQSQWHAAIDYAGLHTRLMHDVYRERVAKHVPSGSDIATAEAIMRGQPLPVDPVPESPEAR